MLIECAIDEYEMINNDENFKVFEVIVVYSGISKSLIGTDFYNRVDESRVVGW